MDGWIGTFAVPLEVTVVVADELVEIDLGLVERAVLLAQPAHEDAVVLDADFFGAEVEGHGECLWWVGCRWVKLWCVVVDEGVMGTEGNR